MFIIDTNVLIDYPDIVTHENIGIAWSVLEELDRIKITQGERAKKARIVLRKLRDLLEKDGPIEKDEEKKYQEKIEERDTQIHFIDTSNYSNLSVDNQLLYLCKDNNYTLITNDINLQVKCIALQVQYESYIKNNEIYTGILRLYIPKDNELISELYSNDFINLTLFENQYIVIIEDDDVKDVLVYRNHLIKPIKRESIEISYGNKIQARNIEQSCLIDALYGNATILYVGGTWGVGKSYILTCYALQELQKGNINKIVYVPNNSQNENSIELGTMPGEMFDKILPYLGTLCDIVGREEVVQMYEKGQLELLPIAIARGRSFDSSIILVNEAQNLTEEHVKLLIARCGQDSRIFFDGDIKQADSNIFRQKSGLKLLTKLRFSKDYSDLFAAVRLEQIERSRTAQAAGYLDEL